MSLIVTTMRWTLLFSSIFVASCAGANNANDSQDQFGIVTSEGTVLANVEGFAAGYTHTELTKLIRDGLARTYRIQRDVASKAAAPGTRLIWRVNNNVREPTAVITVNLVQGSKIIRSAFSDTVTPGSEPDGIFMGVVSQLAQRVLPPAATQSGSSSIGRS
jgi:hypothetical protein